MNPTLNDMAAATWRACETARQLGRGEGVSKAQAEQCGRDGVALERAARTLDYIVDKGVDQFRNFLVLPQDLREWIAATPEKALRAALAASGRAKAVEDRRVTGASGPAENSASGRARSSEARTESGASGQAEDHASGGAP